MASSIRALIVDDQHTVREVLKEGLLSLEAGFEVVTVPSGEEALLEVGQKACELLVADVHLPGMSGLDLMRRLRARYPEMKVILITGISDPTIRRQVADAGADAFFLKPLELADFLDTVERLFGLVETITDTPDVGGGLEEAPRASITEALTGLRQELEAISISLLDAHGRVLVQAGAFPDGLEHSSALIARLMAAYSVSEQVAAFLKQSVPQDFLAFGGQKYDVFLNHVGKGYALLTLMNRSPNETVGEYFGRLAGRLQQASAQMEDILRQIGVPVHEEAAVEVEAEEAPAEELLVEEELLDEALSSLLQAARPEVDADTFWSTATETQVPVDSDLLGADVLSYDQARQLGLAPDDASE